MAGCHGNNQRLIDAVNLLLCPAVESIEVAIHKQQDYIKSAGKFLWTRALGSSTLLGCWGQIGKETGMFQVKQGTLVTLGLSVLIAMTIVLSLPTLLASSAFHFPN